MKKSQNTLVHLTGVLLLLSPLAVAQETTPESPPSPTEMPSLSPPLTQQTAAQMQNMDRMATSVTQMAEMCKMMMQKEMATMHYKVAAGIAFGVVLFLDLLLLLVLEIQWIIYWARLIKGQRIAEKTS